MSGFDESIEAARREKEQAALAVQQTRQRIADGTAAAQGLFRECSVRLKDLHVPLETFDVGEACAAKSGFLRGPKHPYVWTSSRRERGWVAAPYRDGGGWGNSDDQGVFVHEDGRGSFITGIRGLDVGEPNTGRQGTLLSLEAWLEKARQANHPSNAYIDLRRDGSLYVSCLSTRTLDKVLAEFVASKIV